MSKRLNKIYHLLYAKEGTKNPKEFIENIESDIEFIINHELTETEDRFKVTRLISDCGLMLSKVGRYGDAIKYLDSGISLFHSDPNLRESNLYGEPMYEALIANRGMSNFHLRKFKSAKADFVNLTERFPDSEDYTKWLSETKKRQVRTSERLFLVVIVVGAIFSWVFDRSDGVIFYISIGTLVLGLIGSITSEFMKRRKN